jgi:hypothetical protein
MKELGVRQVYKENSKEAANRMNIEKHHHHHLQTPHSSSIS